MTHPSLWHLSRVLPFMMAVGSYKPGPDMIGRCMYLTNIHGKLWSIPEHHTRLPVYMIGNERDIEHEGEPFASKQEENVEEDVQQILGKNKRV